MKLNLVLLALMPTLAGCIPLREISQVQGPAHPSVSLYDRCLLTGFDLNHEKINPQLSYIESPDGKRYQIEIKPHQFDIDEKRSYVSTLLYPTAANGSGFQGWQNGIWSFHFVVAADGINQIIDQHWKFYWFYYCPLIHGAPN